MVDTKDGQKRVRNFRKHDEQPAAEFIFQTYKSYLAAYIAKEKKRKEEMEQKAT